MMPRSASPPTFTINLGSEALPPITPSPVQQSREMKRQHEISSSAQNTSLSKRLKSLANDLEAKEENWVVEKDLWLAKKEVLEEHVKSLERDSNEWKKNYQWMARKYEHQQAESRKNEEAFQRKISALEAENKALKNATKASWSSEKITELEHENKVLKDIIMEAGTNARNAERENRRSKLARVTIDQAMNSAIPESPQFFLPNLAAARKQTEFLENVLGSPITGENNGAKVDEKQSLRKFVAKSLLVPKVNKVPVTSNEEVIRNGGGIQPPAGRTGPFIEDFSTASPSVNPNEDDQKVISNGGGIVPPAGRTGPFIIDESSESDTLYEPIEAQQEQISKGEGTSLPAGSIDNFTNDSATSTTSHQSHNKAELFSAMVLSLSAGHDFEAPAISISSYQSRDTDEINFIWPFEEQPVLPPYHPPKAVIDELEEREQHFLATTDTHKMREQNIFKWLGGIPRIAKLVAKHRRIIKAMRRDRESGQNEAIKISGSDEDSN